MKARRKSKNWGKKKGKKNEIGGRQKNFIFCFIVFFRSTGIIPQQMKGEKYVRTANDCGDVAIALRMLTSYWWFLTKSTNTFEYLYHMFCVKRQKEKKKKKELTQLEQQSGRQKKKKKKIFFLFFFFF